MDLLTEWKQVAQSLADISSVIVSQFVGNINKGDSQLLIFCDASMKAYATALYLRVNDGTKFQVNLLFSKMRLVPITEKKKKQSKDITIPHLELLAVLIGVRAANFLVKELGVNVSKRILWSDSQCILHWLKTRKPLSVFVENHVKEILMEKDVSFQYILSEENRISAKNRRHFCEHKLLVAIFDNLKESSPVTFQEIKLLSLLWVPFIQHRRYSDVYVAIKSNKRHCLQMQLGLKISEYDILRCHGRYQHSELTKEMKYPKLLPQHKHFTYLVIQEAHRRLIHAGVSHTLSQVRQEYWIPQGRAAVRHVISQCVICKRHNGPSFGLPNMPLGLRREYQDLHHFNILA